ncbi:MAG: thiamine phosphate synthase [Pseudomonadota bacterium]
MSDPRPRTRLYLITPPRIEDVQAFAVQLGEAVQAGDVACLQIRMKEDDGETLDADATRAVAKAVLPLAHEFNVAVVVNDSAELALETGADGVHLGQTDGSVKAARALLGGDAIVGATCHDSRHLAMEAGEAGADYVAFGAFHPTGTKAAKTKADPELLAWWQEIMELPCVAIGGVTAETAGPLAAAGADFVAVSAGVWAHPDGPAAGVAAINAVLDEAAAAWSEESLA